MPNVLGLNTKQEAKELRDLKALNDSDKLFLIAKWIKEIHALADGQMSLTLNMVVHDDVFKYFKNTMSYTVVDDPTGQPNSYTKIISITW